MYGKGLRPLAALTALAFGATFGLVFFWTPNEADQGFIQKIFYIHVPLAIVALGGFIAGGIYGLQYLRTRRSEYDLKSYVAIHQSLMFAIGVLITGAIWGKGAWGHWWRWDEPLLVSFLIVFLLYACYQPLRFSIEDHETQARYAAVFAVVAGAFVPINFAAVRMAEAYIHPRPFGTAEGGIPGEMWLTVGLGLVAMTLLFITLWKYELAAKNARFKLRALRRRLGADIPPQRRSGAPTLN
jgi:heme exporter protein C